MNIYVIYSCDMNIYVVCLKGTITTNNHGSVNVNKSNNYSDNNNDYIGEDNKKVIMMKMVT